MKIFYGANKTILLLMAYICFVPTAFADTVVQTNPTATTVLPVQTSPNVSLSPSSQDQSNLSKLFEHSKYEDFEKQPAGKMFNVPSGRDSEAEDSSEVENSSSQ
jgi:hypothetical protein